MALLHLDHSSPDDRAERLSAPERWPHPDNPLGRAGLAALEAAPDAPSDPAAFWQAFLDGPLTVATAGQTPSRSCVIGRVDPSPLRDVHARFCEFQAPVLVRILCGDQQKAVAVDHGVACSTASKWQAQALEAIRCTKGPLPLPLVLAAQAWRGVVTTPRARVASFTHQGRPYAILGVPRPRVRSDVEPVRPERQLTAAEEAVACLLIEGHSRAAIAAERRTSQQTVACQLRNVYFKYRVRGRYALTLCAAERGWFD